jgi:hypothetical protein
MNWEKPGRAHWLKVAAELVSRHESYTPDVVADTMVRCHYYGVSKAHALPLFERDLHELVREQQYAAYVAKCSEVYALADELRAEGWRWIPSYAGGDGGHWRHDRLGDVNNGGGDFRSYEEGTRRAYESNVRRV